MPDAHLVSSQINEAVYDASISRHSDDKWKCDNLSGDFRDSAFQPADNSIDAELMSASLHNTAAKSGRVDDSGVCRETEMAAQPAADGNFSTLFSPSGGRH